MQTLLISTFSPLLVHKDIPIFYFPKSEARFIALSSLLKITGIETPKGRQHFVEKPPSKCGIPLHITSVVNVENVSLFLIKQKGWTDETICAAQRQLAEAYDYSFEQYMKSAAFQARVKTCLAKTIQLSLPHWESKLMPLLEAKLREKIAQESPTKRHVLDDEDCDCLPFKKKVHFDDFDEETNVFAIDFTVPEMKEILFL
jgi:hypothetical protein